MNALDEKLQQIARDAFDYDGIALDDDTTAADVPGWDSLAHVNFMYTIEQEFGIQFSEDEFTGFANIGELRRMLHEKTGAGA